MLRCLFALFASFSLFSAPWVLDRKILEERLSPESTVEELLKVLEGEGVEVKFKEGGGRLLWKRGRVSISLAASPFVPYHLWIDVEGRKTLDECSKADFEGLYHGIAVARKALKVALGADGFMIVSTEKLRNGKASGWAGVEILPYLSGELMDAREKFDLNGYVFYNDFPVRAVSHSSQTVAEIQKLLMTLGDEVEPEVHQKKWTQKLTRHEEAIHRSLESIYGHLANWGAISSGTMPPPPLQDDQVFEILIDPEVCAFCTPKVIDKQLVSEWKEICVIMSHKPLSPYGNFLILPKRHQCSWDLTKEEAVSFFEAATAVKRMLVKKSGLDDCILYIQDGPGVGQTVPHTHMHVFMVPHRVKMAITGIQHIRNKRPIQAEKESRQNCAMYQPLFLAECFFSPQIDGQNDDADKREGR